MIWLLLVVYQLKHYVADYLLQGKYMLGKFKSYPDFILPLLSHSLVHAVFTFCIAVCFKSVSFALGLAVIDATVHFIVDRIKASPDLAGRWKPLTKDTYPTSTVQEKESNTYFWLALGADQMLHHLTDIFLIWRILS